jgi:predicted HTH transcriptional regulator
MVAAREKKFHTLPKLEDNLQINFTELTFSGMKSDDEGGQKGGQTSDVTSLSLVKLTERQQDMLELIRKNPFISAQQMSVVLSVVKRTIERDLADLQKKGILIREGNTSAGHWEIIEK